MDFSEISTIRITMQNGSVEEYPYGSLEYANFILKNAGDIIASHLNCQQKNDDELRSEEAKAVGRILRKKNKSN